MTAKFQKLINDTNKVNTILDAHKSGMSSQQISKTFGVSVKNLYSLLEMHNIAYTPTARWNKCQNPEIEKRDRMFAESCKSCVRRPKCTFRLTNNTASKNNDDGGGPEAVCTEIVENGTHSCWACLQRQGATCHFKCCFYNQDFSVIPFDRNEDDDIFIPSGHQSPISPVYESFLYATDSKTSAKNQTREKQSFNPYPARFRKDAPQRNNQPNTQTTRSVR